MDEGEILGVSERVVVAPVGGVFRPVSVTRRLQVGDVVGHVRASREEEVAVTTPFAGELMEVVAWAGERVSPSQRLAWLRTL